jgi:hypothetical protein
MVRSWVRFQLVDDQLFPGKQDNFQWPKWIQTRGILQWSRYRGTGRRASTERSANARYQTTSRSAFQCSIAEPTGIDGCQRNPGEEMHEQEMRRCYTTSCAKDTEAMVGYHVAAFGWVVALSRCSSAVDTSTKVGCSASGVLLVGLTWTEQLHERTTDHCIRSILRPVA